MDGHNIEALVSSRICHDLISPVGAIGNGIELLESYDAKFPEIGLIADSVDNAQAKLKFFRICFGQSSKGAQIGLIEAKTIGTAMIQKGRLQIEWQLQADQYPRERIKLLYLLLLCVETALPVGGVITVADDGGAFVLNAEGPRIAMQDSWRLFAGEDLNVTAPAHVQFPLAQAIGREIQVENADTWLKVRIQA
jgi:histidine phosphotransferase ChpT